MWIQITFTLHSTFSKSFRKLFQFFQTDTTSPVSLASEQFNMIGSPLEAHPLRSSSCRSSVSQNDEIDGPPPYVAQQAPPPYLPRTPSTRTPQPRTKSIPFGTGVSIEWDRTAPPSSEDIIIVTVRVNKLGRRLSFDDPLPER